MEKKTTTKKTRKQPAFTLLQAIEAVAERSGDSKMSADFMKASEAEIKFHAFVFVIVIQLASHLAKDVGHKVLGNGSFVAEQIPFQDTRLGFGVKNFL